MTENTMRRSATSLVVLLLLTFSAAMLGAQFTPGPWYTALAKPAWTPPNWIFAPVWTVLYVLIAVAAWLVWRRRPGVHWPLALWCMQLGLNAAWSWLFFGLERIALAAIHITLLLATIIATTVAFARVSRLAAVLFVPYMLWVAYAAALNIALWQLNR